MLNQRVRLAAVTEYCPLNGIAIGNLNFRSGQLDAISRSAPIGGLRGANFGFGVESFRFKAPDRFELALSARADCARALRHGSWLVTGLDVEMPRCTGSGITPGARQPFPLEQFPPTGPEAAYAEMQP